ncbi:MAG: amidohydrolase [Saprospiraceae bacterium]
MYDDLTSFRKELHAHPELSGAERATAQRIIQKIKRFHPTQIIDNLGGHGVAAIYDFPKAGKTVLLRADTDALPIQEVNDFAHKSINDGVSHKCGHDGHTTILMGLAKRLHDQPLSSGKVILLFQPAEEIGMGAKAVLADEKFAALQPDYAVALHNVPGFPTGQIVCRKGTFNPAVISLIIQLKGKKAHAAEQENGVNPDIAIASLIHEIHQLQAYDLANADFLKCTTIYTRIGAKDYGISAGDGELHYTLRALTKEKLESAKQKIIDLITTICEREQLTFELEWLHDFSATINDATIVNCIEKVAKQHQFSYLDKMFPFQWGEDFGLFTESIPGAMFGLGAGTETPALHHVDYDFPDEILPYGVEMFYGVAKEILKS